MQQRTNIAIHGHGRTWWSVCRLLKASPTEERSCGLLPCRGLPGVAIRLPVVGPPGARWIVLYFF